MNGITKLDIMTTWKRCQLQNTILELLILNPKIPEISQAVSEKKTKQMVNALELPDQIETLLSKPLLLFLQDLLSYTLLYPRALCELKKSTQENGDFRKEKIEKIYETVFEENLQEKMGDLFRALVKNFGSDEIDEESLINNEKIYSPEKEENPYKLEPIVLLQKSKLNEVIHALGDIPHLFSIRGIVPGSSNNILTRWKEYYISIRDGKQIEAISFLYSQLPMVEKKFLNAKPTESQRDKFNYAEPVVKIHLRKILHESTINVEKLMNDPSLSNLKTAFGFKDIEEVNNKLEFLEMVDWIMSSEPALANYFDTIVTRIKAKKDQSQIEKTLLKVLGDPIFSRSIFPGNLYETEINVGLLSLGLSLKNFEQRIDIFNQSMKLSQNLINVHNILGRRLA